MDPKRSEMPDDLRRTIQGLISEISANSKDDEAICSNLKRRLDQQLGETWNVIAGKSFGCNVAHERNTFGTFSNGSLNVVVYKLGL